MHHLTALLILVGVVFAAADVAAQDPAIPEVTYPRLPKQGASAEAFVPPGWTLETQVSGDLNRDGIPDLALVLRDRNPKNVVANPGGLGEDPLNTNPRVLAVVFGGGPSGGYARQLENHTLIPRHVEPTLSDPLVPDGVAIDRGKLRITLELFASAGSWTTANTVYTFRYQHNRFELIGFDRLSTHRGSGARRDISINCSTGRMKLTSGNIAEDAVKVRWKTLPRRPPLTIERIGNGLEFDPEG